MDHLVFYLFAFQISRMYATGQASQPGGSKTICGRKVVDSCAGVTVLDANATSLGSQDVCGYKTSDSSRPGELALPQSDLLWRRKVQES